jgi:hypothetical protein
LIEFYQKYLFLSESIIFGMPLPKPHNPYFLVRTERVKEKEAKTKIGILYVSEVEALMQYNLSSAEIVDISERAAKYFPEAKVGHQLLMHHFVIDVNEDAAREDHLVHQDDVHNYYVVTAYEHNGKGAECYGVWDGEKIIPNKDFVFLEDEKTVRNDLPPEEAINQSLEETATGLFLFKQWKDSREDKEQKQARLKKEVESLAKSGVNKPHIQQAIREKEREMEAIGIDINKQKYQFYTVAFSNPELTNWFNRPVSAGHTLAILNIAAQSKLKFMDKQYIICKSQYIAAFIEESLAA